MYCGKCGKEIPEGQTICEDCTNKLKTNNNENGKSTIKKSVKISLIIIISIILLSVIITIITNSTLKKTNNLKENIETNNSIESKDENIIIFDSNTKYGATFNLTQEDIDNAIKSAYQGSECEKLLGVFGNNNSEWTKVENNINDYEMYFYISAITQDLRKIGLYSFKIGINVDTNNHLQSITFTTGGGKSNDYVISEITKYNSVYEEFYYLILNKLFTNDNIINNMKKVQNANKINGISSGGITIHNNIIYSNILQLSESTQIYSRQYQIGAVGNEKANELINVYKGSNTGIYIDINNNETNNGNNIEQVEDEINTIPSDINESNNMTSSNNNNNITYENNSKNQKQENISNNTSNDTSYENNNSTQNTTIEQIKLPNLVDLTETEAINKLESLGLEYSITRNTKQVSFDNPNAGKSIVTNIIDKKDYYSQYDRVHLEVNQYQESGISIGFIINTKELVNYVKVYVDNKEYSAHYFPNMSSETFYSNGRKSVNVKIVLNNYSENIEIYNKNINLYEANKTVSDNGHTSIDIGTIDYKS